MLWPEFSWETVPGDPASRCVQVFAPDISWIGYTDRGRVYSIICPRQGTCSASLGCLAVEVSVTGQRGWVDELKRTLAADVTAVGQIWFTPSAKANPLVEFLLALFADNGLPFPADKARPIQVSPHRREDPSQPVFPVHKGQTDLFDSPARPPPRLVHGVAVIVGGAGGDGAHDGLVE